MEDDFELYELEESDGECHSILHVPKKLSDHYGSEAAKATSDTFNILMADISGSMWDFWPHIVTGWQESIKDKLTGRTNIYCFGDLIKLMREGTELTQEDFTSDGTNDLTGALRTVRQKVEECPESNVRVFIIADGAHDHGEPYPETEIEQMRSPLGKTVSVFVFGLGPGFPVQNSLDIRAHLHSGNANIPYLFWAKRSEEIVDQLAEIGEQLNSSMVKMKLNVEGSIAPVPGLDKTNVVHLDEWLYFEKPPKELPLMTLSINDGTPISLPLKTKQLTARLLLNIFRQWNSVMIQEHRKKADVPYETFRFMESLFEKFSKTLKQEVGDSKDVKSRLARNTLKSLELDFRTLMNQGKSVILLKDKFKNDLELAELVLKSTVTNKKYDNKNLKLKGHSQDDYKEDIKAFQELYEKAKEGIMALPSPLPDDCCRVTITSTLTDLQDPDFLLMLEQNKFDFLKSFTMTGIPIYAPVRDASQINPWTIVIKHILVTPFTILSQLVLEESAAANNDSLGNEDKDVILQQDNEKTRFNAIIPIVPANAARVLKPLVLSNVYAMVATFCILKNPHIVDYNAHLAALGCAWTKTVGEYPGSSRPEFACCRLENLVATAKLYLGRPSIKNYIDALINKPNQALMTESSEEFDGKPLKCESMVKPLFFAYLHKDKLTQQQVYDLYKLVLREYVGRCLSGYRNGDGEDTPFTDFFCSDLSDKEKRKAWLEKQCKVIVEAFCADHRNLLERFFTLDDLIRSLRNFVAVRVSALTEKMLDDLSLGVDIAKVKKLNNPSSCGDVRWSCIEAWAQEMGISKDSIQEESSSSQVQVYVSEALQFRNSKDRLAREIPQADSVLEYIKKKVIQEKARDLRSLVEKEIKKLAVEQWHKEYSAVHRAVVMPLTQQEVVEKAQARGIVVSQETFSKVYRYNERLRLLRNACQIVKCPHFLQPHNNFNQHIAVEREQANFPHTLHLVSHEFCNQGINGVIEKVVSGTHAGTQKRKQPVPPEPGSFEDLTEEIKSLLKVYSNCGSESSTQGASLITEDEEFFDCTG